MTDEEAKKIWFSFSNNDLVDYIDNKFDEYRKMGYEVDHFRSLSSVSKDNKTITCNRMSFHEIKTISEMDEYLKNLS
jgi:hypothetical protein